MKDDDVPQDNAISLGGQRKRLYARTTNGDYTTVLSSGWEAEEVVLQQAISEYDNACSTARLRVLRGQTATLEYHMYRRRMDITLLAQSTGLFQWQVRRHLKPSVFRSLPAKTLQRYQDALQLSAAELTTLDNVSSHD